MPRSLLIKVIYFMILRCEICNLNDTWDQKYGLAVEKVKRLTEIEVGWPARYVGGAETGKAAHRTLLRLLLLLTPIEDRSVARRGSFFAPVIFN
jgi:hypothetical protein